jgi:hypothetical protein
MPARKPAQKADSTTERDERKTREEILEERRKLRPELNAQADVMRVPDEPGLVFRWTNDQLKGGRSNIAVRQKMGWEIYEGEADVSDLYVAERDVGSGAGHWIIVGKNKDTNQPEKAVLMAIRKEYYEADQQLKEEKIRETELGIKQQAEREFDYGRLGG